jgi:hypothetical protein
MLLRFAAALAILLATVAAADRAGTITQPPPFYRAHLHVAIQGAGGRRLDHVVEVTGETTAFRLDAGFPIQAADLDPDYEVLRWTPEYRALADAARAERAHAR